MSEFVTNEPAQVVIGVCGEQAAGKTVFLTCIFQSVWTAFPDDVIVDFDRTQIGNASYFQGIEDALIGKGPTQGTTDRALYPARIYIRPYEPLPDEAQSVLSVDILDFAGRHFRSIADLKNLLTDGDTDAEDTKALREVNATLERADAFVVLINAREVDPMNPSPSRNPFGPSVNFILAHCRAQRKPVALLFSQVDQTPMLTEDVFHAIPRVQRFEQQFTSDLAEASRPGGRPYGVARRIACYETVEDDLTPRKQSEGGNIWRPEPAQIVLDLIRAAMPTIRQKILAKATRALQIQQDNELAAQRRRRMQMTLAAAAAALLVVIVGLAAFAWYQRDEGRQTTLLGNIAAKLREGDIASISTSLEHDLGAILTAQRASGNVTSAVWNAARDLDSAAIEAGRRLTAQPLLDPRYEKNVTRFQSLLPHFGNAAPEQWDTTYLPLLNARGEFLSSWFGTERSGLEKTHHLDDAAKRFATAGDQAFSTLLAAESTREKEAIVAKWQSMIDADPDVESRLATLQKLLISSMNERDPEFRQMARTTLAAHVVTTILKRSENNLLRESLLAPLVPELARFGDGEVRFDVLARDLLECSSSDDCATRQNVVQTVANQAVTNTGQWTSAVENLLRSILLDLPRDQRREIWNAMSAALANAYFFSGRNDAWPDGIVPLHADIAAFNAAENDYTLELIARIARYPLYSKELVYLKDRLAAIQVRRRMVSIYSTILSALSQQGATLPANELAQVSSELTSAVPAGQTTGPLVDIAGEIHHVLGLVQSINTSHSHGAADLLTSSRLERLLREAKRTHCGELAMHEAPTECSDAA